MAKTSIRDALAKRAAEKDENTDPIIGGDVYAAMFGFASEVRKNRLAELSLSLLVAYSRHPFKAYPPDRLAALAQSIKQNGLQQPIIVRRLDDQYEILAGHNRSEACKSLGWAEITAIVIDVDDDQAAIVVTETNLRQREKLLPSEKAFAYRLQLEAMKHQGQKGKKSTSTGIGWKSESAAIIAHENDTNKNDIRQHIRLTYLVQSLLDLVDERKLAFGAAVNLSYMSESQQAIVYAVCIVEKRAKVNAKLVSHIRECIKRGYPVECSDDVTNILLQYEQRPQKLTKNITFSHEVLEPYLSVIPEGDNLEVLFLEFLRERYENR